MKLCWIIFPALCSSAVSASQSLKVEYRLEAKSGGHECKWASQVAGGNKALPKSLEDDGFMSNGDFSSFETKKLKSPPSNPNSYEVELLHTEQGRKKFDAVANRDRDRVYCVVIENEIYQCLAFAPEVKGLWDKSTSIYGPFTKSQAEFLVKSLRGK